MNALGQQALDETAGGFDDFPSTSLKISDVGRHRAFGIFLAYGLEIDACLLHQILHRVVVEGLIGIDGTTGVISNTKPRFTGGSPGRYFSGEMIGQVVQCEENPSPLNVFTPFALTG